MNLKSNEATCTMSEKDVVVKEESEREAVVRGVVAK